MNTLILRQRVQAAVLAAALAWAPISLSQSFKYAWPDTDFEVTSIDLSEIMSGGPPKDGIPPIDHPTFDSVEQASQWIDLLEPVIAVSIGGISKAYPLQILTWHEIVNDEISGTPITVTFCPLCNASIVFDRRLAGTVLDFGTTGLLRMSDLVMYDRQSESWWQQFIGTAIVGEYTGQILTRIDSSIVSFKSFASAHPEGQVLNRDTGLQRPYGQNPYPGYDDINNSPFLFRGKTDDRLPAMERVIGITINGQNKIYPFSLFDQNALIEDRFGETDLLVVASGKTLSALDNRDISSSREVAEVNAWQRRYKQDKDALNFSLENGKITDIQTGSQWNGLGMAISGSLKGNQLLPVDSGIHFAFAWLAFNPKTSVYSP